MKRNCPLAIGSALALAFSACLALGAAKERTLDIYWVDVEGGGATLMVMPTGESVLVDTGIPGERDSKRIYHVAKEVAGLQQIDHLVTTHFDIDHFGGAADLAALIPVAHLWDGGIPEKDPSGRDDLHFGRLIKPYREMKVGQRHAIEVGGLVPLKPLADKSAPPLWLRFLGVKQKFITTPINGKLAPNSGCDDVPDKIRESNDNANCAVLLLSFGQFRFYDGADLLWDLERELVCPVNLVDEVDVFQVTHHGFDISNHPLLVRSLKPTVAVMVNGVTKGCSPATTSLLRQTPSIQVVYQLHKNLRPDATGANTADDFIANLEKNCQANYIQCTVAPDGFTYTLSIPAKHHVKNFKTKAKR